MQGLAAVRAMPPPYYAIHLLSLMAVTPTSSFSLRCSTFIRRGRRIYSNAEQLRQKRGRERDILRVMGMIFADTAAIIDMGFESPSSVLVPPPMGYFLPKPR